MEKIFAVIMYSSTPNDYSGWKAEEEIQVFNSLEEYVYAELELGVSNSGDVYRQLVRLNMKSASKELLRKGK